jgi:hypothetical protein
MTRDKGDAMNKEQEAKSPRRRDFLRLAGLGSVAAGAVALAGGVRTAEAGAAPEAAGRETGYRETAHVKRVYELSRF